MTDTAELKPVAWRYRLSGDDEWHIEDDNDRLEWLHSTHAINSEPLYSAAAIASLVRERDEARAEVARYWTSGDITPWVTLAEEKGLGHFGKKLKGMFNRAISAEDRAEAAEADAARMRGALEERDRTIDFVTRWAWRENAKLTDEERLSVIKYHPKIKPSLCYLDASGNATITQEGRDLLSEVARNALGGKDE